MDDIAQITGRGLTATRANSETREGRRLSAHRLGSSLQ